MDDRMDEANDRDVAANGGRSESEDFHEPSDNPTACFRLELFAPEFEGLTPRRASWGKLREIHRRVSQSVQLAVRNVIMHIGDLRVAGRTRFAVPAERANAGLGVPLPAECYTAEDIEKLGSLVTAAIRTSGTTEYIYSSVARKLLMGEFSKSKLRGLLKGEHAFPMVARVGITIRNRNWRLQLVPRTGKDGKEYLDVEVYTSAWVKGQGTVRLLCCALHGRTLARALPLLRELDSAQDTPQTANGWKKGALLIRPVRRPGQKEKWELLLPYQAPRRQAAGEAVMAVHRSVVNMLSAAVQDGKLTTVYHYPGRTVVALKHQLYARRRRISQDIAARLHPMRQSARRHYKALRRLADAEARATQTELWRAARWMEEVARANGAKLVYLDDFTSFDPDRPGPPWEPYVRRFPWADLKLKCIDALTRRLGVPVQERKSQYISQRCPECGYTSPNNIAKLPTVHGVDVEKGRFVCSSCGFSTDPDVVAARNLLISLRECEPLAK